VRALTLLPRRPRNLALLSMLIVFGFGINARLTTEIIVAKLLLDAKLIDTDLFTALVAESSLSTVSVPILFTLLVRKWREQLDHRIQ